MNKTSFLFLLIIAAVSLIGAYQAFFPLPAQTVFTRFFALSAYFLLCVSLIIGPIAVIWPKEYAQLIEPRRAVGIASFIFALLHIFIIVAIRYGWDIAPLLGATDPLVSVPATIILLALTLTSADYAIKALGPAMWKNVQRFNYLAFALSSAHFLMKANGLLASVNGKTFLNFSEAALCILGLATVALQLAGFFTRRARMAAAGKTAGAAASKQAPQ